ncbi:hypothetical protein SKAU_G00296650 [Synaphobranchus kaupii]|uniref:Uncharacterized protein n=1 Tax=Synaphobranchus kaupii TaxID=118154 RepID=A0A9Q1EUU5_SYNKA|nr:hypothetical protein SKAU_G00296650 [Synaphobranchus kaupii]
MFRNSLKMLLSGGKVQPQEPANSGKPRGPLSNRIHPRCPRGGFRTDDAADVLFIPREQRATKQRASGSGVRSRALPGYFLHGLRKSASAEVHKYPRRHEAAAERH